ncbi:MAG: sensor histidine kinase, partial [Spirochaetales bacterium]|nr:sensor histidine kinase [Spirochaetales bacterium]
IRNSKNLRTLQIIIILLACYTTVILTMPGTLTGILFLILALVLAYQYSFFASKFYIKIFIILSIYMVATFTNIFFIYELKLPFGIPSILFSIVSIYLFWTVFRQEINSYLVQTNQLNRQLSHAASENARLENITTDQAVLINEKNFALEKIVEEKTEIEKELRRTLKVKDVLLQEVHHRVKNNLTVINGLFNLQRSDDNSEAVNSFIEKNSNRLYAMAAVHETIYQKEDYELINLNDYFSDIIQNLVKIHTDQKKIKTDIHGDNVEVKIDIAVPLGIILNDCISNSIVYGFNGGITDKVISVRIKKNDKIEIRISDNGERFSKYGKEGDSSISFSTWLIETLVEDQLHGTIETRYNHGNIWTIKFPYGV